MPVKTGKDNKGCFAQWGNSGKKYYFECNNPVERAKARTKAEKQSKAIRASGYKG